MLRRLQTISKVYYVVAHLLSIVQSMELAAVKKIPPAPPVSLPVWSLACPTSLDDNADLPPHSMNIVTFCTGLSVGAPKLYAVSLYYDTLTKDSFLAHGYGVLQLLRPEHKQLVPILGKQSGYDKESHKQEECAKLGYAWQAFRDYRLLPDCGTYLLLRIVETLPAGDHLLAVCQVEDTLEWNGERIVSRTSDDAPNDDPSSSQPQLDPSNTLYTGLLRTEGIIG